MQLEKSMRDNWNWPKKKCKLYKVIYRAFMKTMEASLLIQKLMKRKDVRFKIAKALIAINTIQAWIRSIWLQRLFKRVKQAVCIIKVTEYLTYRGNIRFIKDT